MVILELNVPYEYSENDATSISLHVNEARSSKDTNPLFCGYLDFLSSMAKPFELFRNVLQHSKCPRSHFHVLHRCRFQVVHRTNQVLVDTGR